MHNKDTVFWLTLVDFLVQVIFFGLFMGVTYLTVRALAEASEQNPPAAIEKEPDPADVYAHGAGFSSVAKLTDELSRLVPADQFNSVMSAIVEAGGADKLVAAAERERKSERQRAQAASGGFGLKPCQGTRSDDNRPQSLAAVRAYDDRIEFLSETAHLRVALEELGLNYADVRTLSVEDFRTTFLRLRRLHPECSHYLYVEERYEKLGTHKALEAVFIRGNPP